MAVVGIDLGTTNTVVGYVKDGQARTLTDDSGRSLIPSVVSFHPNGGTLVGHDARNRRAIDGRNTIYSIKRLIGRSWNSEEVARARKRFPFDMKEGPGQAALVVARDETFTLPEISAFVLRHAKALAEKSLGEEIDRTVITVPANFNDLQRAATKVSGRVAGLEVMRILNEPTAAALAYGYGKNTSERIAIYDFGGGTFDFTLLDLSGNVFEVLATGGNTFLGGDDIDVAIADRMAEACLAEHRLDPKSDRQAFERLRLAAERAKIELSTEPEARVELAEIGHGPGGRTIDFSFTLTQGDLADLAAPIVDRTFEVCEEALAIARLDRKALDQVILVGGSTRLAHVKSRVRKYFGREPLDRINPDEVVAIGAAIQASALAGGERRRSTIPKPPMPAARATQTGTGRRTGAPPLPRGRTDPAARVAESEGRSQKRVVTGIGLGPVSPSAKRATPPKRPPLPTGRTTSRKHPSTLAGPGPGPGGDPGPGPRPHPAPAAAHGPEPSTSTEDTVVDVPIDRPPPPARKPRHKHPSTLSGPGPSPFVATEATFSGTNDHDVDPDEHDRPTIVGEPPGERAPDSMFPPPPLEDDESVAKPRPKAGFDPLSSGGIPVPAPEVISSPLASPAALPPIGRPVSVPSEPKAPPRLPADQTLGGALKPPPPRIRSAVAESEPSAGAPTPATLLGGSFSPAPAPVKPLAVAEPEPARPPLPLLVDVTPLALCVETIGGYCDTVIERNTPVPCAESRVFVTAADNQTTVRVRVGQGSSSRFDENTELGEVELTELRPAPRGATQLVVSFRLDTDGILDVLAKDGSTGRQARARLNLVAMPNQDEIARMVQRQEGAR